MPLSSALALRVLYSEWSVGTGNGRNGLEKEKSHERGGERRRRTVARVTTSIRFSSSCGEVVKTFLLPPGGWRRDANGSFRVELCYYNLLALLTRAIVSRRLRGKKNDTQVNDRRKKNELLTMQSIKRDNIIFILFRNRENYDAPKNYMILIVYDY